MANISKNERLRISHILLETLAGKTFQNAICLKLKYAQTNEPMIPCCTSSSCRQVYAGPQRNILRIFTVGNNEKQEKIKCPLIEG